MLELGEVRVIRKGAKNVARRSHSCMQTHPPVRPCESHSEFYKVCADRNFMKLNVFPVSTSNRIPNSASSASFGFRTHEKSPITSILIAVWKIRTTVYPIENNHHRPSLIAEILPPISACSRTAAGPAPPRPIPDHPTPPGAAFFAVLPAESVRSRARQRPAQVEARGAKEDN